MGVESGLRFEVLQGMPHSSSPNPLFMGLKEGAATWSVLTYPENTMITPWEQLYVAASTYAPGCFQAQNTDVAVPAGRASRCSEIVTPWRPHRGPHLALQVRNGVALPLLRVPGGGRLLRQPGRLLGQPSRLARVRLALAPRLGLARRGGRLLPLPKLPCMPATLSKCTCTWSRLHGD